jgi:hypothetical protein
MFRPLLGQLFNKNFVNCCETEGIIIYSQYYAQQDAKPYN